MENSSRCDLHITIFNFPHFQSLVLCANFVFNLIQLVLLNTIHMTCAIHKNTKFKRVLFKIENS